MKMRFFRIFCSAEPSTPHRTAILYTITTTGIINMSDHQQQYTYSARSISNGLIAGYAAGTAGIIVGHPLDSIKVLLQTNGGGGLYSSSSRPSSRSATSAHPTAATTTTATTAVAQGKSVITRASSSTASSATVVETSALLGKRSIRALYAGITGPLLTSGLVQSCNFAMYDTVRRVLYDYQLQSEQHNHHHHHHLPSASGNNISRHNSDKDYLYHDNLINVATASFLSGSILSIFTSPMSIVKTKQQLAVWGFKKAIIETYYTNGGGLGGSMRGFYIAYGPHFICESVGRSFYMFVYEYTKRQLVQVKNNNSLSNDEGGEQLSMSSSLDSISSNSVLVTTEHLSTPERMACAALAGMSSWALIFPFDVIKSKLYARTLTKQSPSLTMFDGITLAKQLVREQGITSLYRGIGITVARGGPVAATVLPVYDYVLAWATSRT